MTKTPTTFVCHIAEDIDGFFWQCNNFPNVLVGSPFKVKANAVASCNRFMDEHSLDYYWEKVK